MYMHSRDMVINGVNLHFVLVDVVSDVDAIIGYIDPSKHDGLVVLFPNSGLEEVPVMVNYFSMMLGNKTRSSYMSDRVVQHMIAASIPKAMDYATVVKTIRDQELLNEGKYTPPTRNREGCMASVGA